MRTTTSEFDAALANPESYKELVKVEIYPSLVTFSALTRDYAIPNADTNPATDDPMRQDIHYDATAGLVTFYADGSLKYALDGDATPVTTTYSSSIKPGLFGDKIFVLIGSVVNRYTINWATVAAKGADPLTLDLACATPPDTPVALHAISSTECVGLGDGDGGLSITHYVGSVKQVAPSRFMSPSQVDWDDSGTRDMNSLGIMSGAVRLGNRVFVYCSHAAIGTVQGIFFDTDTNTWSDIFTALPTDLDVSMCEFRISNCFVRNNSIYMAGQFIRTDLFQTKKPYTLILASTDGEHFSIDRFSYVSGLGYRFLATVGSDNNLYLANSNRVCEAPSTWVFDGDDDSTSPKSTYTKVLSTNFNEGSADITISAGDENVFDDANIQKGSRVKLYDGLQTTGGPEYILFETYIANDVKPSVKNGQRKFALTLAQEGQWKLSGLTMPFYAEWQGLSSIFDPMTEESGKLYAAPGMGLTETEFWVDFWDHVGYKNASLGISKFTTMTDGGVDCYTASGSHKKGLITKNEIKSILGVSQNPKITGTSIPVKIYGWSRPETTGNQSDKVNIIMQTCNEKGSGIKTVVTTNTDKWPQTWPDLTAGEHPISFSVSGTGISAGRYIKKIGLVFEQSNTTVLCPARVEVTGGVEVEVVLPFANTPWEAQKDGTFAIPAQGQPFIMFSQRPYNAFNFDLSASFDNSITGGISGYPAATGLIGHAEDGLNFTLARYDVVSNKVQLVVVRNGVETQLHQSTPGWTLGTLHEMVFRHKDGRFKIYLLNETSGSYEQVMSYDWKAADGFMTTSKTITMKCGIWGGVMSPSIKTMGYAGKSQDGLSVTDGIPIDPMGGLGPFPSSGELTIDGNVYSYGSRKWNPTYVAGPYQVRNNGVWPPPYGNGKASLECRYFDWNANPNKYKGKLISLSTGSNFISAGSLYRVWITTASVVQYLRNRSRHYSDNAQISKIGVSLSDKCWPGLGGFFDVKLIEGKAKKHAVRARAILHLDGDIICYWYMGTGGERDVTIRNLIETTTSLCGVKATFPGDFYDASLTVNGETAVFQDAYGEGFDLEYDLAAPTTHEIRTNVKLESENYENGTDFENDTGLKVVMTSLGSGNYRAELVSTPSNTTIYKRDYTSGSAEQHFRILFHSEGISIYQNYRWVMAIACDDLTYTQTNYVDIKAYAASSTDFSNVYVHDLSDVREAIYIDLETDGSSAISSIIQERPIEIGPNPDGSIYFFYDESNRDTVTLLRPPLSHEHVMRFPTEGMSDAIVYGAGDVFTYVKPTFADELGFSTKIVRTPSMDVGAPEAAYRLMKKAYEAKDQHTLTIRPDSRLEVGDLLTFSYTLSGSGRQQASITVLIESIRRTVSQSGEKKSTTMTVTARGWLSE